MFKVCEIIFFAINVPHAVVVVGVGVVFVVIGFFFFNGIIGGSIPVREYRNGK